MNKKITKIVVTSALVLGFGTATLAPSIASAAKATSAQVDNTAKINELIKQKMELIQKKKVSRDKKEQKALGKQIDQIEKEIKQLKKAQYK